MRDGLAHDGTDVVSLQPGHDPGLHMLYNGSVNIMDRTGIDCQIMDAQGGDLIHHHVQDIISIPQVMMERRGHTVFQATGLNSCPQSRNLFTHAHTLLPWPPQLPVPAGHAERWGHPPFSRGGRFGFFNRGKNLFRVMDLRFRG